VGARSGGGATSGPSSSSALANNIEALSYEYPLTPGGYFGVKSRNTRAIVSDNPMSTADSFWKTLSRDGRPDPLPNGKGDRVRFDDNSLVVYRVVTTSNGSPAVEIWVESSSGRKIAAYQKIHFVLKESR